MSQVIGRVVTGTYETVRGPDVVHRIGVDRAWLKSGELVEVELPRNLACAACEGGGCDRCGRSGAITLRERGEPSERVQITLPRRSAEELHSQASFVLRVPDQGGWEREHAGETRGLLLLKIVVSGKSDASVRRVGPDALAADLACVRSGPSSGLRVRATFGNGRVWGLALGLLALLAIVAWISR